ncbi:MAG: hypothetical protein JWM21_4958 [Acidobacteria bacterium]|nr:hypothetical protein [Acidobacteriota bacterium]
MFAGLFHVDRKRRASGYIILGLFLLALGFLVRARPGWTLRAKALSQSNAEAPKQRIEGEVIVLNWTGFEPREISRSAGPFLLLISNYSHLPVATLVLEREGKAIRSILLAENKRHWSDTVDLPSGTYILREATHSNWYCKINLK